MAKFFDAFILLSLAVCAVHVCQAMTDEEAIHTFINWTHGLKETVSFHTIVLKVKHDSYTFLLFCSFLHICRLHSLRVLLKQNSI